MIAVPLWLRRGFSFKGLRLVQVLYCAAPPVEFSYMHSSELVISTEPGKARYCRDVRVRQGGIVVGISYNAIWKIPALARNLLKSRHF
jgi:hypothetical protein